MGSSGKGRVSGSHGFMHEDSIGSAFDDPNFFMDDDDEAHFDENHDHDGEDKVRRAFRVHACYECPALTQIVG